MGERAARGRGVCGPGGTKALSMSTLCQVWRPDAKELAPEQQASGSLHDETVGRLQRKPRPGDFPGGGNRFGVLLRCPTVHLLSSALVLPGPGSDVGNMLGWPQLEKTARSWFGGSGVP